MRALLLFTCFVLALLSVNARFHPHEDRMWVALPSSSSLSVEELLSLGFDVRGDFGNLKLLLAFPSELRRLPEGGAVLLTHEIHGEKLFVLRSNIPGRHYRLSVEEMETLTSAIKNDVATSVRIIGIVEGRFIIGKSVQHELPSWWPYNVGIAVKPVAEETVVPLPTYANSTAGQTMAKALLEAPNPVIQALVDQVDRTRLINTVQHLNNYFSRLATTATPTTTEAENWLARQFESFGLTTRQLSFRTGYTNNVIGELRGSRNPERIVLVGAHYDSRAASMTSSQRAPGADDNASGCSAIVEAARIITANLAKTKFAYTIQFCLWSGEEQGLYGSAAYATKLSTEKQNVVAYLNADMISYKVASEAVQLGFDSEYVSKSLTADLTTIAKEYTTGITVGSASGCCSDNGSFHDKGFLAAGYFERNGGIRNPYYHTSNDAYPASANDFTQVQKITQAILAGVATLSVPM